jgi:hypothetical protein
MTEQQLKHLTELVNKTTKRAPSFAMMLNHVDDNFDTLGKGGYVKEFMDLIGRERIYTGYQWVWKL